MSFIGRSIRNRYPLWSTIRRDDSSTGGRIIDTIGESLDELRIAGLRMSDQLRVLEGKPIAEPGNLWSFSLSDSDAYSSYTQENKDYRNVTVIGNIGEAAIRLKETRTYEDLCLAYSTRSELELEETRESFTLINIEKAVKTIDGSWNFNNKIYKVYFDVKNSDYYYDPRTKERFNYNYFITIRGVNIADFPIEETIYIKDDGLYETKNYFKEIKALKREPRYNILGGKAIEREGFDGEIKVAIKPYNVTAKEHMYTLFVEKSDRVAVPNSLIENHGFFELRKEEALTYLDYIYRYFETGDKYRVADVENPEAFQDILFSQALLGSSGESLNIVDYCFDTVRNKVVTIDTQGVIRFYKIGKSSFNSFTLKRTKAIDFSFEAVSQQVALYETAKIYGILERPKGPVVNYCIIKEENGAFSCLQDDMSTWSETIYLFKGRDRLDRFENADSFEFSYTFNNFGQVNFYIVSFANETDNEIIKNIEEQNIFDLTDFVTKVNGYTSKEEQYEIYVNSYGMMCEYSLPEHSIQTNLEGENFGIFFEGIQNHLYIIKFTEEAEELYKVKEYKDYFIFDYDSGEGATLEEYDSISIEVNSGAIREEIAYVRG